MPARVEVWLVDLGMAQKTRPAVVVSTPPGDQDRVLITIVSPTTAMRGSPSEIAVPLPFLREGAFLVQSITTIPAKHALRRLGLLTPAHMEPIERGLRLWLQLCLIAEPVAAHEPPPRGADSDARVNGPPASLPAPGSGGGL